MVDSPILDNQVIGNSYLRTSENRKTRYDKSDVPRTWTNSCRERKAL